MPWFQKHLRCGLIALIVLYTIADAVAVEEGVYQTKYRQSLDPQNIKLNFENLTAEAHIAGSDMDHSSAQVALEKFRKYGLENSWIEETQVTVSYPDHRFLLVFNSTGLIYNAILEEPPIASDPTSYSNKSVATFNGYSPSGNVTAPVVYVNYGSVEDYETLNRLNISVSGKIVLARYGKLFRGCKVMLAELHGAVGVILYSDPNDDGIGRGIPYPDGPWRPFEGVQRGSVQYLSKCPGDPDRNHSDCQNNLPKIPVQPISAKDAEPIITNLRGTAYNWTTWWSNTTYLGDDNGIRVNLDLKMDFVSKPIWNVYAQIDGVEKDRTLIIGAHRDAWVFGGADPATGSSVLLEIAHGLGEIKRSGWVPARSIMLVSWDGEEYGLLGSTWFGEINKRTLQDETIAYLNLDMAAYGNRFVVDATPSLNSIIREIATQVNNPNMNTTIAQSWDGKINRLGSGSDYTVFIHHLGIPSAHFSFEGDYGVYHSIYDSTTWVEKFGDPSFMMHKAMAEYVGLLAMNITDSDIFPFNYTDYAHELSVYFNETMQLVSKMNASSQVNLQPLEAAIKNFTQVAHDLDKEIKHVNLESVQDVMSINDRLIDAEKQMLDGGGLPQRPWYKHQIQAPGYYLGYGSEIFPGITQNLNEKNWTGANQYILTIAKCITNSSNVLSKEEDTYGLVSNESYLGYQIFMILFTVIIIGSFVGAIWYFRRSRKQYHKNSRYAMMEMDEQL